MNYLSIILLLFLLMGASECQKETLLLETLFSVWNYRWYQNQTLINLTVQAQAILTAKCMSCHNSAKGNSPSWDNYYNDVTTMGKCSASLIVPGDGSDNSNLINRTDNCGTTGDANMPTQYGHPAVTNAECTTLKPGSQSFQNI